MDEEDEDHIRISEFSPEDREGILRLLRQLVRDIYGDERVGLENYEKYYKAITFYKKIKNTRGKNIKIIVAKKGDKVVGFASVVLKEGIAHLEDIVVDKCYRGKGIGNMLINYTLENISRKIKLETHKGAIKFFEKMGFKVYKKKSERDGVLWFYMKNF